MLSFFRRWISRLAVSVTVALFVLALYDVFYPQQSHRPVDHNPVASQENFPAGRVSHRKLLQQGKGDGAETQRVGEECSKDDIVVYQGATAPLPNGIPTYTVEVLNVCVSGCAIARVHLSCGWFSSARLVNPRLFRRLRFDDCLLNDGHPLPAGSSLTFQYANSFRYPLSVSSAQCLPRSP